MWTLELSEQVTSHVPTPHVTSQSDAVVHVASTVVDDPPWTVQSPPLPQVTEQAVADSQ